MRIATSQVFVNESQPVPQYNGLRQEKEVAAMDWVDILKILVIIAK